MDRLPLAIPGPVDPAARDRGAGNPAAAGDRRAWRDHRFLLAAHRRPHQSRAGMDRVADLPAPRQLPYRASSVRLGAALQPARAAPRDGEPQRPGGSGSDSFFRYLEKNFRGKADRYFGLILRRIGFIGEPTKPSLR